MEDSVRVTPPSFPLSLRPWPRERPEANSLPYLIGRIHEQRGHFRNITEKGLIELIQAEGNGEVEANEMDSEDEGGLERDIERRQKEVYEARGEMIRYIAQAQNDALMAQDFIALLLSQHAPKQGEQSISPALKQAVPIGSLGYDLTQLPKVSQAEQQDEELVARGRKLQSLTSAAGFILDRAKRLEAEVRRETRYWEQILSITEKGWSVTRLPRERNSLGVRFGFAEAAPEFKERGFAALRANEDGDIILDQGLRSRPKAVRVRIQRDSVIVGTSRHSTVFDVSELPVESLIHRARNSLYAEELFWEITREARMLSAHGVSLKNEAIVLPLNSPQDGSASTEAETEHGEVLIDLIALDQAIPEAEHRSSDALADSVALSLRVLLSQAHRQKFRQRTQQPPPLAERKRSASAPVQTILRPILGQFHHQSAISRLQDSLASALATIRLTHLRSELTITSTLSSKAFSAASAQAPRTTTMESLVSTLSDPFEATAAIMLPSSKTLTINLTTHLTPPINGTEYLLHLSPPITAQIPTSSRFTSLPLLCEHVKFIITTDITQLIQVDNKNAGQWQLSTHDNELKRTWRDSGKSQTLRVSWEGSKLVLKWKRSGVGAKVESYSWDNELIDRPKGLWEVVADADRDVGVNIVG